MLTSNGSLITAIKPTSKETFGTVPPILYSERIT